MSISARRWATAALHAEAAFFILAVASCYVFTWLVRDDQDGQAGMGAAFGAFYLGCMVAIITLIVSLRKSSRLRRTDDAE